METKTGLAAHEAGRPLLGPPGWPVQLVDPPQNLERARPPLAGLVRCPAMSARTIEDRQPLSACFPYRFSRARHLAGHRARSPIEPFGHTVGGCPTYACGPGPRGLVVIPVP